MIRLVGIVVAIVVSTAPARADDKALKPYAGQIVISPYPPPSVFDELPKYLKINYQSDGSYDVRKGPPWHIKLVAVLAKDPGTKTVTLTFADKADKKLVPIQTIERTAKRKVVFANVEATIAAGFAEHKTYVVQILFGKTVVAKCEVTLKG